MASKKKVAVTPVSYHEWVKMKARLYTLDRRANFRGEEQKKAGRLTREERSELAFLRKRCESSDSADYALSHYCEAIAGGVIVPEKEQGPLREALKNAYRVCYSYDLVDVDGLVDALAALGVAKADLPKHIDEEDEEEKK